MHEKNLYKATALFFGACLAAAIGCASAGGSGMSGCGGGQPATNTLNCPSGTHQDPNQPTCTDASKCCVNDSAAQKARVGASGGGGGEQSSVHSQGEP